MTRSLSIVATVMAVLVVHKATVQAQVTGVVKTNDQNNQPQSPQPETVTTGNGINYNGGPVMPGPHNVYFIWYGNWSGNNATTLLPTFISDLNGSAYFNTNTTYGDNSGNIANTVSMAGTVFDNYSQHSLLTDAGLQSVVSSKLLSGALPTDVNGIYFVLSSADVDQNSSNPNIGQFCVNNCGFHQHAAMNGADIKYAFVGNPDRCPVSCEQDQSSSPNDNTGADGMASTIAHELNEAVTDPDLNAWFDVNGKEVGDKCRFNFAPTFTTSNGSQANMILNGKNFIVQQNWVNGGGGFCAMSLFLAEPLLNPPSFLGTPQAPQMQFSWSQVPHNAGYRIMVATAQSALPTDPNSPFCIPDNTACTINDNTIAKDVTSFTSSTASPHNLLPETTYFWQVHGLAPTPLLPGFWSAVFSFTTSFRLSVGSQGTGRGTVTSSDGSVNCGSSCSALFNPGTTVTLTAVPTSGSTFTGWSGCSSSTPTCTVTMNAALTVSATFTQQSTSMLANFSISAPTVVGGNSVQGLIQLTGPAPANTTVTLTDNNPHFAQIPPSFSNTLTTGSVPIPQGANGATFTIMSSFTSASETTTITATDGIEIGAFLTVLPVAINGMAFNPPSVVGGNPAPFMVSLNGPAGAGTLVSLVSSDPTVLQVPSTVVFPTGTNNLSINATTSSVQTQKVVTVTGTYNLITAPPASLTVLPGTSLLTVAAQGTGKGTVTSNDGSINCGSTCTANFNNGTMVTLTATPASGSTFAGWSGCSSTTPTCTVIMNGPQTVSATFTAPTNSGLLFVPVTPCRVADTRNPNGSFGGPFLGAGTTREFVISDSGCNIPATAQAYSLNVTVVPHGPLGFLTMFPCGQPLPLASTLNSIDGRIKANAAIVPAGTGGAVCAFVENDTDLVLDINGYFVSSTNATALAFYPMPPCRLVDTREPAGPLAGPSLLGHVARTFPILSSSCNVPAVAQAYSLNFTSVPKGSLGFLTTWPAGLPQPLVSTLNAPTGTVVANAAIVPAGTNGDISVFVTDNSDLVIDVDGYFAPPGPGGLSLVPVTPCRVLDTRSPTPTGGLPFAGELDVNVAAGSCKVDSTAQTYVLNVTVVPAQPLGFLTLWPQGTAQPVVSTLNALDAAVTSNMAMVPTTNGSVSAYASNPTHLIFDISGFFVP